MATTLQDIKGWYDRSEKNATHMLIVCDTFGHEDYPVYVGPNEDLQERIAYYNTNMQRVMEVYSLDKEFPTDSGVLAWDTSPAKSKKSKKPTKKRRK